MRMRAFLAALLLSATPALAQTTVVGTGGMQTTGANATAAALQALATNAGSASLGLNDGDANSQFGIKYNGTSVYPFGVLNTHGDYIFNFDPSGYVKTEANSDDGYTQGPPYVVYFNNLSPANGDTLGHYAYLGNDSAHNYQTFSYISSLATDVTDTALSSRLQFGVMNAVNGSSGPSHQPNLFMTWDATNGLALSGMPITGAGPITATSAIAGCWSSVASISSADSL